MNPKDIVRHGYDRVSHAYRSDTQTDPGPFYAKWIARLVADAGPRPRMLDLGCGCGMPVAKALAAHGSVTGVDISPVQIERARRAVPQAQFLCADMSNLQFQDRSFDAVLSFYALIHVPLDEQPGLLRQIANWLKPGGVFVATLGSGFWTGTEQDWLGVAGAQMYWSHADPQTYRSWLAAAGMTVVEDEYVPEQGGKAGHQLFYARRDG
jgi:ubiquinone/menaquinone biosynthesis C-methylase UbiE